MVLGVGVQRRSAYLLNSAAAFSAT
jgi:hypothetical protein